MITILVVEDDINTRILTETKLKKYLNVITAKNGFEALEIIDEHKIDLIVSDIMMPEMNGYELVRTLRESKFEIPVILLTAKQSIEDKKEGFLLGIDDYMTKPINYDELLLRIHSLLRRAKVSVEKRIQIKDVLVDSDAYTITKNKEKIEIPKKEFELLFKLLSYPGKIFTKYQLLDDIWGFDSDSGEDTIKVHINRLRNKLKDISEFEIVTLKGIGYKIEIKE